MKVSCHHLRPIFVCLTLLLSLNAMVTVQGAKVATPEEIEKVSQAIPDKIEPRKKHQVSAAFTAWWVTMTEDKIPT